MKITIVGSGKVAVAVARAVNNSATLSLAQLVARNSEKAEEIFSKVGIHCEMVDMTMVDESLIPAEVIIIAVSDNALADVYEKIRPYSYGATICHTSGSTPIFEDDNCGVFYPLQTFSQDIKDFKNIPVFIETTSDKADERLIQFCRALECRYGRLSSAKREGLHLAAVFANNFINHIATLSADICKSEGVSSQLLNPLMEMTLKNIVSNLDDTFSRQTGPAIRGDFNTIARHRELLNKDTGTLAVYDALTLSITAKKRKLYEEKL